tara:strand:+ start:286 stop:597 length:312 start_codon:yes stop_codon:yes gene_type:complete
MENFDKIKTDNLLKALQKTKKCYDFIYYHFDNDCNGGNRKDDITRFTVDEYRFRIDIYFCEKDGFDKWVETYSKACECIDYLEGVISHYKSIPNAYLYLQRNL